MKKDLFFSIMGFLLFSTSSIAQIRTIEHPKYESCNTESLEINKVEMNDAETVLYCIVMALESPTIGFAYRPGVI